VPFTRVLAEGVLMQRRRFIEVGMSGCIVAPLAASQPSCDVDAVAALRGLMAEPLRAARIGRACLECQMVEPAAVRAFVAGLGDGVSSRGAIEDRFHARRHGDFAHGRLQSLHGWQLAESEVLAFAAVALS
jgi:hypothetical protein